MRHSGIVTVRTARIFSALLAFALLSSGCLAGQDRPSREAQTLINALLTMEGSFVREEATGDYEFTAKQELESILARVESHQRVRVLVDCLDELTPARVSIDGKPAALGVLCYQGLSQTAYYEPSDVTGDIVGWAGDLMLPASTVDLRRAKEAWLKVIADSSYVLL